MTGKNDVSESDASVADRLISLISRDTRPERRAMLESFARMYVRRLRTKDIADLTDEQLLAEIDDFLAFANVRKKGESSVRVFRPTVDANGYETSGSVVQIVSEDGPFLADSVTGAVSNSGANITRHLHPVMGLGRDDSGELVDVVAAKGSGQIESVQHFELDRELTPGESELLELSIRTVLRDVAVTVRDFDAMRLAVGGMIETAKAGVHLYDYEEIAEDVAFLEWLLDDNFVFLGYRDYLIGDSEEGVRVQALAETGLGILSANGTDPSSVLLVDLPKHLQERFTGGDLMVITKTNRNASVHRDARMDYIGVRQVDDDGRMIGEKRLLGLFTSKAYMAPASEVPVLRRKLRQILSAQDVIEGSHDYKSMIQIFESFPKDDLFAMPVESLSDTLGELIESEESPSIRLFVRRDALERFVSVLVTVPRDRFNSNLRKQLQDLFIARFDGRAIDYRLALGESGDARIHFSVWTEEGIFVDVDVDELEREVIALARNWDDRVVEALTDRVTEKEAVRLADTWTTLFPEYYKSSTGLEISAGDIMNLDALSTSGAEVLVGLQNESGGFKAPAAAEDLTRVTVYRSSGKLNLSQVMPLMEDLGLTVVEEVPTRLHNDDGTFIHDFGVLSDDGRQLDVERVGERISEAIEAVLAGTADSDSLHRLLVSSDLTYLEILVLRAYRSYWRLVTPAFSREYVDDTLAAHPKLAEALVRLFQARFSEDDDGQVEERIEAEIRDGLNQVASLDEDRIIRGFLKLILATVRTNLHLPGRSSLALKLRSHDVPEVPDPTPLFEIYVYAKDVEGIHLRGGMVARGGIRWSDRREDYRTEVLGLMKAQMTKNVVIVPTGAKGGFVVKNSAEVGRPTYDEVKDAYEAYIQGLLDVTDNRVDGAVVPPRDVIRHDGDDAYLVVAADKGTASFSDAANEISASYGFWLDDAFASGGSAGYDHKTLGITARGAWESVRRHFRDLGVNVDEEEITVVGIGDMSGDVFGNGMLLSSGTKLVAAFDHRHIFIDPDPDVSTSADERRRLFSMSRSSWADYDDSLISDGGGVFARSEKRIELSSEMRKVLGSELTAATPNELIRLILTAPVDLLWNGGIGTYVKARSETNGVVQDRANDAVRVNGRDLRCRVVGEGGNLGFTQLGRIEFDVAGGQIFTDFIDNSGGVNASDREVNLKILLRIAEESGDLERDERDEVIASVSQNVVDAILHDNFLQAQIISQEAARSAKLNGAYVDLMDRLEREGLLNREIEYLPSTDEMIQRGREGIGMSRPEIAVLLSYAKMSLTDHLLASTLPDDAHFQSDLFDYFPLPIVERFGDVIEVHPLRRELIAMIVANQVLNSQGSTFYSRLRSLTGASPAAIVKAYRVARSVTNAPERWLEVESLGLAVEPDVARNLMNDVDRLVTLVSRWYLAHPNERTVDEEIALASADFARLSDGLPELDYAEWRSSYEEAAADLVAVGVPEELAVRHAFQRVLRRSPDIIDLAHTYDRDVLAIAAIYTRASQELNIGWLERQIRKLPAATTFDRLAIESLRDDLQQLRRDVVSAILDQDGGSLDGYVESHDRLVPRLERWHTGLNRDGIVDVAAGMVATRTLRQILVPQD